MRRLLVFPLLLLSARAAFAVTCGGFSIVTADHIVVKYSVPVATGATRSTPLVSMSGTDITVTRTLSGGSATDVSCVDETIDLGYLGGGRFNVTWNDNVNLTTKRSTFTFSVGAPATGYTGDFVDVLPPALPDRPVRLEVDSCFTNPAVAYVSGYDIYLSEYQGPRTACKLSVLDLGVLPAGTYNVSWGVPGIGVRFIVQQPAPTSACTGRSTVIPKSDGTVRLHFEDGYRGYTPAFGPPTVTGIDEYAPHSFMVIQPVADSGNSAASGAPPSSTICHAEELDLGAVANGYHDVQWLYDLNVNGFKSYGDAAPFSFYWQNGTLQCTSDPALLTPSVVEGVGFDVVMNVLYPGWQWSLVKGYVNGHTITVNLSTFFEGPSDSLPSCHNFQAAIAPLPAGEYTVVWVFNARQTYTTPLAVVDFTQRRRAARH